MKLVKIILIGSLLFLFGSRLQAQQTQTTITILMDNNLSVNTFSQLVEQEIEALLGQTHELSYRRAILGQDFFVESTEGISRLIDSSDILVSLGLLSSQILGSQETYEIPSIAGISLESSDKSSSGIFNFNYIQSPFSIENDLLAFQKIYPFQRLGIFVDEALNTILGPYFQKLGVDYNIELIPVSDNPQSDLKKLSKEIDAVYLLPQLYKSVEKEQQLIDSFNDLQLPSFSLIGRSDVNRGIMASISPTDYISVYARRIALNVMKILEGENAKDLSTQVSGIENDFVINMSTIDKLQIYPSFEVLSEASLVDVLVQSDISYSIESAIATGLAGNLSFQVSTNNVDIQDAEIGIAKSNLLPQLTANTNIYLLDNNTSDFYAAAGLPNAQAEWTGNIELSQLIYSRGAWANVAIQKSLLQAEQAGLKAEKMNLITDICMTYLQCLQAQANVEVQNNNVKSTRYNLNIAKTKEKIGTTSKVDVYGFETQLALNKTKLNDAQTQLKQIQIALNQLLNRPLNETFILEDIEDTNGLTFLNDERIVEQLQSVYDFRKVGAFLSNYVVANAPELEEINWAIAAQNHSLNANKNSLWQPVVALQGSLDKRLGRYGTKAPIENFEALGVDILVPTWNIGVGASLPIFQGNLRKKRIEKDKVTILQLEQSKDLLKQQLSSNIHMSVENLSNSYSDVMYLKHADESSSKYLKVVQELYREGVATIVTLIDAQNNALSAKLGYVSSQYQYLIDAIVIERFLNNNYLISSETDKNKLVEKYFNFILKNDSNAK